MASFVAEAAVSHGATTRGNAVSCTRWGSSTGVPPAHCEESRGVPRSLVSDMHFFSRRLGVWPFRRLDPALKSCCSFDQRARQFCPPARRGASVQLGRGFDADATPAGPTRSLGSAYRTASPTDGGQSEQLLNWRVFLRLRWNHSRGKTRT